MHLVTFVHGWLGRMTGGGVRKRKVVCQHSQKHETQHYVTLQNFEAWPWVTLQNVEARPCPSLDVRSCVPYCSLVCVLWCVVWCIVARSTSVQYHYEIVSDGHIDHFDSMIVRPYGHMIVWSYDHVIIWSHKSFWVYASCFEQGTCLKLVWSMLDASCFKQAACLKLVWTLIRITNASEPVRRAWRCHTMS